MRCDAKNELLICIREKGHSTQFFPPDGHNWQPSIEYISVKESFKLYPKFFELIKKKES